MTDDPDLPSSLGEHLHSQVRTALTRLEDEDRQAAEEAHAAWAWLAGDSPPDTPLQHQLQDFLWYALPRKWDCDLDGQLAAAEALARLCELVGARRYAQLCRSSTTREILAAYARDEREGFDAYRRALDRSGIDPPDVAELAWGGMMSVDEALAREHVAARLEEALVDGRFSPGRSGWRTAQREAASEALAEPLPDHPGDQTWLQTVVTARIEAWLERYQVAPQRWRLVAGIESALLHPVAMPADAGQVVAPLRWLLERAAGDGLALTDRGNLARAVVSEASDRFGWEPLGSGTKALREQDIIELTVWDEQLRAAGLVRRRGRRLVATPAGREATAGDDPAWRALARVLVDRDGWDGFVRETVLLMLLQAGDDGLPRQRMLADVADLAAESGWRTQPTGQPPGEDAVSREAGPFTYHLRLMGLADQEVHRGADAVRRLLPVGRATAIEAIRVRATAPAHPFGG